MSETRQYEVVYVVSPEITEEGVTELHERIAEIVGQLGGSIDKTDNWGRRRLAYEINRHREGTYVIELVTGPGTLVTELDRRLRVMEQLLRHLVVRVDEDLRKARRARERLRNRRLRRRNRLPRPRRLRNRRLRLRNRLPRPRRLRNRWQSRPRRRSRLLRPGRRMRRRPRR